MDGRLKLQVHVSLVHLKVLGSIKEALEHP